MRIQALDAAVEPRLLRRSGSGLELVEIGHLDRSVVAIHGTRAELLAWAQRIVTLVTEPAA